MQEVDGDVAVILRDLVEFLECLAEVELPEAVQTARETLLSRSRATLQNSFHASDSPEPYLDMNAGKSMLLLTGDEAEQLPEYIGADDRHLKRGSLQHYYETFQDFQSDGKGKTDGKNQRNKDIDNVMLVYTGFSAAQAKDRASKSGPLLHLKRERRMFAPFKVFWLNRWCWVSLLGSHLLLYASERENRPYLVIPLRGYKSRPAPGAIARDSRRSESAFEIYCPGDRTFQFVAKGVQEMREWVNIISENFKMEDGCTTKNRAATFVEILELESNELFCIEKVKEEKEKYQDVLNLPKSKAKDKATTKFVTSEKENIESKEEAPPLPSRTRRLPSLPSQRRISYDTKEEPYDEEGLYHRIEDIKAQREYQNCQMNSNGVIKGLEDVTLVDSVQETYDDVENISDGSKEKPQEQVETYDDIQNLIQDKNEPISYDDVQDVAENLRINTQKNKSLKSSKSSQKRSFLYRVCNRKESIKKDDKKAKSPTPSTSSTILTIPTSTNSIKSELPCYDDISNLSSKENCTAPSRTNEEDYQSPPPPRPIYSRPPTIIQCAVTDEIYDDIGYCIKANGNGCKGCTNIDSIKDYPKNNSCLSDLQLNIDQEYYQVPKSNNRKVDDYQEELYDDVALSETFKNRQRDASVSCSNSEKSVWSRFGSGKRPRIFDHVIRQTSCNDSNEISDETTSENQNNKIISFQKFINKMENTLGKATKANSVTQN